MELTGEKTIAASRDVVWRALNDPDVLKACIPGCRELTREGEHRFDAVIAQKVGPVSVVFKGQVTLTDVAAPERYRIEGSGKGGAAGFASGAADVRLEALGPDETKVVYAGEGMVGGKLGQLGGRVVDAFVKKMAERFFGALKTTLEPGAEPAAAPAATPDPAPAPMSKAEVKSAVAVAAAANDRLAQPTKPEPDPGEAPHPAGQRKRGFWRRLFG